MSGPFEREIADAWAVDLVDLESLNAHVSDAILAGVEDVRRSAPLGPTALRSSTLLALGPAGSGKTHLFARVRRRSGPRAAFVLVRPGIGVESTPRQILTAVVDSLRQVASGTSDRQLDVIAATLLASASPEPVGPHVLLDESRAASEGRREELIVQVTARLEALYPEIWVEYLERLLRAPFLATPDRRAGDAWLEGRELTEVQLSRLGGGASLGDADVMPALRTLAIAASFGAPVVLVFDQLENLVASDGQGQRVAAYGNLVSELHDMVRGLVIVQLALDAEWERNLRPRLAASHLARVEARLLQLALPTPAQREGLVYKWIGQLPAPDGGGRPPFPWPFTAAEVTAWRDDVTMTPRSLMIACREALAARAEAGPVAAPSPPQDAAASLGERLEELWQAQLARGFEEVAATEGEGRGTDAERLAAALVALGAIAEVEASSRMDRVTRVVRLGPREARLVQHPHPRSVAAALEHASEAPEPRAVVVLREHGRAFPPTWRKVEQHSHALERAGGRLAWLLREDVARLLALHDFLAAGRSQDLADAAGRPVGFELVERWVRGALAWRDWRVTRQVGLAAQGEDDGAAEAPPAALAAPGSPPGSAPAHAVAAVRRLGVASVDRVVREVRRVDATASRTSVRDELVAAGSAVRWYGDELCASTEAAP